ncbi:ABC transporter ATP-binding protein [Segnochrobactrum spirostomi]|uniref:ABC transporter ATP-binding protein n=1 Tax=Segnochrobactrum spirostomi TaxID=2608987 RepID=A0A6A7Y368_9HYPH|nr:ABC transporter ATP-binding protein [Segnochrobactrum spirostomi]MQT13155.1 ABC transporter ATP-binding protein [Segnochrobactrum spirostomi]
MSETSFLSVREARLAFGRTPVLNGVAIDVARGEFVALLGASGCGKTTLLRAIAGFQSLDSGAIRVAGRDVTAEPPERRGMALVFQSYALWPHMTVAATIGYGLKLRGIARAEIERRVTAMLALLGLDGLGGRKPAELSGGQRQRVALGRALAVDPEILLLDEPLSNLDARIRLTVRHEIRALQRRLGITAIHVTHDREEAMVMADRIVILDHGNVAQAGTPESVYNAPASAFVAAFMGAENVLPLRGARVGDAIEIAEGPDHAATRVPALGRRLGGPELQARFRPEAAKLLPAGAAAPGPGLTARGTVTAVSYPGGLWRHAVAIGGRDIQVDADAAFEPGLAVTLFVPAAALFLFEAGDPA